jgi:DNA-binding response OmpR family regulator
MRDQPHILIVEDNPIIAMELEDELQDQGFAVMGCAATVAKARALMLKQQPALVILDMHLKSEATFDLALDLRAKGIAFFFLSGSPASRLPPELRSSKVLTKTVSTEDLLAFVKSVLPQ